MKEDIRSKDGKRKLYFTVDMQKFIYYNLDPKTTCDIILKENKAQIQMKFPNENLDNYDFFLIDLKGMKKGQTNTTKVRVDNEILLYYFLQNPKTILCFLQKNQVKHESNIKAKNKNKNKEEEKNLKQDKIKEMKKNYLTDKVLDNIFNNKTLFLYNYDSKSFVKLKANLNEKQLTIHGKNEIIIYIQDITTIAYCSSKDPRIEILLVKDNSKLPYYMIITTTESQYIIGFKSEEKKKDWEAKLNLVIDNYRNFTTDIDFTMNIKDLEKDIISNENNIILNSLNLNNYFNNNEKRKIFYSIFQDKKIPELIEKINSYRNSINQNNYKNAMDELYNILIMVNQNNDQKESNKKSKLTEIINKEKFNSFHNIYQSANNSNNADDVKKILNINLFDEIISNLSNTYINPALNNFEEDFKKPSQTIDKTDSRKVVQSLPTHYFMKLFDINSNDSFLELK
jgi:hypothetical protein